MNKYQNVLILFYFLLLLTSCMTTKSINNEYIFTNDNLSIFVKTIKYEKKTNKIYGSISIENKTNDTLFFNFNQAFLIGNDTLKADYNIKPISYANIAFYVYPKTTKIWDVAWNIKYNETKFNKIVFIPDTTLIPIKTIK